jgi:hypothetical protein
MELAPSLYFSSLEDFWLLSNFSKQEDRQTKRQRQKSTKEKITERKRITCRSEKPKNPEKDNAAAYRFSWTRSSLPPYASHPWKIFDLCQIFRNRKTIKRNAKDKNYRKRDYRKRDYRKRKNYLSIRKA